MHSLRTWGFCFLLGSLTTGSFIHAQPATTSTAMTEEYSGIVTVANEAEISARSDGLLDKIHFLPGEIVHKDDLLFEFNPTEKQLLLDGNIAKRKRAEVQLRSAELELNRNRPLRERNLISEEEYVKLEIARDTAAVNLQEAMVAERGAEIGLRSTKLYAPFTGLVSRPYVKEGAYIVRSASERTALAYVTQFDPIFVRYEVPYSIYLDRWAGLKDDLANLEKRVECTLTLPGGGKFSHPGHPIGGGYEFNQDTQAVSVWAEFPNPDNTLRPGLKVKVQSKVLQEADSQATTATETGDTNEHL